MTKYNSHKQERLARECHRQDLFFVSEGIQCGNCLILVIDHREDYGQDKENK